MNPQGCTVSSFKVPTELERGTTFLWRVHQQVPARGMIGIFNRSHYEDILVPRVHELVPKKSLVGALRADQRVRANARGERCRHPQVLPARLPRRAEAATSRSDSPTRRRTGSSASATSTTAREWDDFTKAYHGILAHTSTKWAPWYVVPADDKDVRDWLVARAIADCMDESRPPVSARRSFDHRHRDQIGHAARALGMSRCSARSTSAATS